MEWNLLKSLFQKHRIWKLIYSISDLPCAQAYSHFLRGTVNAKFSRYKSSNLWQGFSGDSCYWHSRKLWPIRSTAADFVALLQLLRCLSKSRQLRCKTAAESFKGCTALLHPTATWILLSCCLASKMLLNSCNLAVQQWEAILWRCTVLQVSYGNSCVPHHGKSESLLINFTHSHSSIIMSFCTGWTWCNSSWGGWWQGQSIQGWFKGLGATTTKTGSRQCSTRWSFIKSFHVW